MPRFALHIVSLGTLVALAGCGSGTAFSPSSGIVADASNVSPQFLRPAGKPAKDLFVLNYLSDTLYEFSLGGALLHTFPSAAGALADLTIAKGKIYVTSQSTNTVSTFTLKGKPTTPTITTGLSRPTGVAVDKNGKIYVTNSNNGTLTTYLPDGTQTTPTISGLNSPSGVVVDKKGKIYVALYSGGLETFTPSGTQTTPTITGLVNPTYVAVDAKGKIYICDFTANEVLTFTPSGVPTTPTITANVSNPAGLALDAAGNIYVSNRGTDQVTWYAPDGSQNSPTLDIPGDANGAAGVAIP